jgi:hypothetical protein
MKKVFSLWALSLFFVITGNAQNMEVGSNMLNLGVGVGGYYNAYSSYTSQTPAIGISFDHGFKQVGPGIITLGGYLGYKQLVNKNNYYDGANAYYYKWTWTYLIIGFRSTYQYKVSDKFDIYGGLLLSLNNDKFTHTSNDPSYNNHVYNYGGTNVGFSIFGGAHYLFSNKFGAFGEIGYGVSYLTLGLSLKF